MTGAENVAPHFQAILHLAHEQVVFVLVMKIESGAADLGAIEHFPNGNVVEPSSPQSKRSTRRRAARACGGCGGQC